VVVRGEIAPVAEEDVDYVRGLGLSPWVPTYKDFFVTLSIEEISGRHFIFARQPERGDKQFSYDPEQPTSAPPEAPDPNRLSRSSDQIAIMTVTAFKPTIIVIHPTAQKSAATRSLIIPVG